MNRSKILGTRKINMIMYLSQSDKGVDYGVQRLDVKYSKVMF